MEVLNGTRGDIDSWISLVREVSPVFPGLETEERLEEHRQTVLKFMAENRALCVKTGGEIVGVLLFSVKHNMICCLAVSPAHRKKGIASALLTAALERLDGGRDITVNTFREGDKRGIAARALYKKFGFVEDKLVEEFGYPNQVFVLRSRNIQEADMKIEKCTKGSFTVIGKEGSSKEGAGSIQRLWEEANSHFGEIAHLAKKDENGVPLGVWGAMSDFSRSFKPWEGFSEGLYLAGAECEDGAEPPEGWVKWVIPSYEYLYVECENENTFSDMIKYLNDNDIPLAGAVHDFTCPQTGKSYMFFPVRRL